MQTGALALEDQLKAFIKLNIYLPHDPDVGVSVSVEEATCTQAWLLCSQVLGSHRSTLRGISIRDDTSGRPILVIASRFLLPIILIDGSHKEERLDTIFEDNNASNIWSTIPLKHCKCSPLCAFMAFAALGTSGISPISKHFREASLGQKWSVLLNTNSTSSWNIC